MHNQLLISLQTEEKWYTFRLFFGILSCYYLQPSYFSFPKLSFIEPHTIILEVYFKNIEFHSLILGVIFGVIFTILGAIFASCVISLTLVSFFVF